MKKKITVIFSVLIATLGLAWTSASASGGGSGPSTVHIAHVIQFSGAERMNCHDQDILRRKYGVKVIYKGNLECEHITYASGISTKHCNGMEHDSDRSHAYQLWVQDHNNNRHWTHFSTRYATGNPTSISIDGACNMTVNTQ